MSFDVLSRLSFVRDTMDQIISCSTISSSGDAEFGSNITVTGYSNVSGDSYVGGNSLINGDSNVSGNIYCDGNITSNGDIYANSNVTVAGNLNVTHIRGTLDELNVIGNVLIDGGSFANIYTTSGDVAIGNSSGNVSIYSNNVHVPVLMSTANVMIMQPCMPYDEVYVIYNGISSSGTTSANIFMQTNWLANSWSGSVTKNGSGDYTFTFVPSLPGGSIRTWNNTYLTSFQNVTSTPKFVYTAAILTSLSTEVRVTDINGNSGVDANGCFLFKILNGNKTNHL